MAKFKFQVLTADKEHYTARLGAGAGAANYLTDKDIGKPVTLVGDSQYDLCTTGQPIHGFITAVESSTPDDYSIGSVAVEGRVWGTVDTTTVAINDYVVAGAITAKGTAIASTGPKILKATNQPGATVTAASNSKADIDTALAKVVDQTVNAIYAWKVVSLGSAGTGAAGTSVLIERVAP